MIFDAIIIMYTTAFINTKEIQSDNEWINMKSNNKWKIHGKNNKRKNIKLISEDKLYVNMLNVYVVNNNWLV